MRMMRMVVVMMMILGVMVLQMMVLVWVRYRPNDRYRHGRYQSDGSDRRSIFPCTRWRDDHTIPSRHDSDDWQKRYATILPNRRIPPVNKKSLDEYHHFEGGCDLVTSTTTYWMLLLLFWRMVVQFLVVIFVISIGDVYSDLNVVEDTSDTIVDWPNVRIIDCTTQFVL